MGKVENRLGRAIQIAERSSIKSFWTGAVLMKKDEPISVGWSHYSDLNLQRYRSIHAELHCILRANRGLLRGATIYVATIRAKSGNIGLAKPCLFCRELLHEVGVQTAFYTVDGPRWERLTIEG